MPSTKRDHRYICPSCRDEHTVTVTPGHVKTPRCEKCRLLMYDYDEITRNGRNQRTHQAQEALPPAA